MSGEKQPGHTMPGFDDSFIERLPGIAKEQFENSPKHLWAREAMYKYAVPKLEVPKEILDVDRRILDVDKDVLDIERLLANKFELTGAENILDVGCGDGSFLYYLYQKNKHVYTQDENQRFLSKGELVGLDKHDRPFAKKRREIEKVVTPVEFWTGDAKLLPWAESSFDIVICSFMLYHEPEYLEVLAEIQRTLKPNGVFAIATRGNNNLKKIWDLNTIVINELSQRPQYSGLEPAPHWYSSFSIEKAQEIIPKIGFELVDSISQIGELQVPLEGWGDVRRAVLSVGESSTPINEGWPVPTRKEMLRVINKRVGPLFYNEVAEAVKKGGGPHMKDIVEQWIGIYKNLK